MKPLKWIGLILAFALTGNTAFTAQDPSLLLEKAIYAEETLGNLEEAITIYRQVVAAAEADRATAALALYRLGICYQKSGRAEEAKTAFARLTSLYPDQQELISRIPGAHSSQLALRPAPWIDGEVLRMLIKVRSGSQAGTQFYSIESAQESGKPAWELRSANGNIAMVQYASMLMDAVTLVPIGSVQNSGNYGVFRAQYAPQQVEFVTTRRDSIRTNRRSVDAAVYDYAQLPYLLRCLPLREGFQSAFLVAIPEFASVQNARLAVVAREKVTVPAGSFDCYRATLTLDNQAITYWISADTNSYVVKEDHQGTITTELASVGVAEKNRPVRYKDSNSGISVEAPYRWLVGGSIKGANENWIILIGPEAEADGSILFMDRREGEPGATPLDEDVDKSIASEQRQYEEYAVRQGSRDAATVSGLNAIRLIADFKQMMSAKERVRYQFYFRSPTREYRIRFETDKDNFEKLLPVFDSIVSSFSVQ
jgi:hypothetical protein